MGLRSGGCRGPRGCGTGRGRHRNSELQDNGGERELLEAELKSIDEYRKSVEARLKEME
jgi:hypothetical protein